MQWYEYAKSISAGRYTLADIGRAMGVGESAAGHYLNGRREPNLDGIKRLAALLEISPGELLNGGPIQDLGDVGEQELISTYRHLSPGDKERLIVIARALKK